MEKERYVAYYRVSTKEQDLSGLGLDAQRTMVENYTKCTDCIIQEYVDVASGKSSDRPQLAQAIEHARGARAKLIIAKLDRLSRNAGFIFALRDSGVDFICADMPIANTLTIGMFATLAQYEREVISERTKAALAAKKAKGYKLGSPANLTEEARLKGLAVRQENAKKRKQENMHVAEIIRQKRAEGMTYQCTADHLNSKGYRTRQGNKYKAMTVLRLDPTK